MTANQTQVELMIYGRFSYCYVHAPYQGKDDNGNPTETFCTHILIDPLSPAEPQLGIKSGAEYIQMLKDAQRKVAMAGWPSNPEAALIEMDRKCRLVMHDGDTEKASNPDYKGKVFVSANSKKRPTLVETRGNANVPLVAADNRPYSGSWGFAKIAVWAQSPEGKKSSFGQRINAQLMGLQHIKHDTAFGGGGRVASVDEFAVVNAAEADAPAPAAAARGGKSLF
jgi:hypothetical protein